MDKHAQNEANQIQDELEFGSTSGITDIDDDGWEPPREQRAAAGSRLKASVASKPVDLRHVTAWNITEWAHLPLKATDIDPVELDRQVELMRSFGQTRPVIVRPTPNRPGLYEAIGSAWIAIVAARLSEQLLSAIGREANGSDAPNADDRAKVLAALNQVEPGPAKTVFAALRCAVSKKKAAENADVFSHAGHTFGLFRSKKGEAVRIDLDGLGDIELDVIVDHIREKLATLLRATSF